MKKVIIGVVSVMSMAYSVPIYAQQNNNTIKLQDDSDLRLALTKVTLYSETNEINKAFKLIDELKAKYPNNSQVMMAAADLNLKVDNTGSAFDYINKAHTADPLNEDILYRRSMVLQDRKPYVTIGSTLKRSNQATEYLTSIAGKAFVSSSVSTAIVVENDDFKSKDNIVRANGGAEPFDGSKQRANLMLNKFFNNGNVVSAMLHVGNEVIGGGAEFNMLDRWGKTSINANIDKPEWDFIESVVGNGSTDNVAIARKIRIASDWEANIEGGLNRYNLEDASDVAKSREIDISLGYIHPFLLYGHQGDEIYLGANYNIGGEYFSNREYRTNSLGDSFAPFSAVTYEVHSLTLSASKNLTESISADAYGGYAEDRFGSGGALYGAGISYSPNNNISLEFLGSSGTLGERRIGKVDQFSLNLKVNW